MQVPEKLSLIGGSILLASTLVFTLKSQASDILPKVDSGMSSLVHADKSGQSSNDSSQNQQAQADQTFNNNFQQAQQKGWQTGNWGTAKFYVDGQGNMHVGAGQLNGPVENLFSTNWLQNNIKTINLDEDVQAPQNSYNLFGAGSGNDNYSTVAINGLSHLDTSNVNNMDDMFAYDHSLNSLDVSHFDTHNVNNMDDMFAYDHSLNSLDVSHFDTHNVNNMGGMFVDNQSLTNLDLSHFDTSNVNNMDSMFDSDSFLSNLDVSHFDTHNVNNMYDMFYNSNSIHQLSLGSDTKLQNNPSNSNYNSDLSGTYQNNDQTLNLDGNAHPGTWIKQ